MARRGKAPEKPAEELAAKDSMPEPDGQDTTSEEENVTTTTEPEVPVETNGDPTEPGNEPTATEPAGEAVDPDKLTDEELDALLTPFTDAVSAAADTRDETTGTVPDESFASVNAEYTKLTGAKLKNRAKAKIDDGMKDAMNSRDIQLARAYMDLRENLAVTKTKRPPKEKVAREPVNPTEAFVSRVAVLNLGYNLATTSELPENVDDDWADKVATLVAESTADAATYRAWLDDDSEDKGEEPDVSDTAKAAVKLSMGRSAKPGRNIRTTTVSANPYSGPRRDIGKHIEEAFADKAPGTFMRIAEIGKFNSTEYSEDHPSPGAISARLFPSSGKCTLDFVTPGTNAEGNKGATKN